MERDAGGSAPANRRARTEATLERVADALGQPVETFTAGAADQLADDGAELVRLWFRIECVADRRRVLELARSLARA